MRGEKTEAILEDMQLVYRGIQALHTTGRKRERERREREIDRGKGEER